jgi:integrase/recombinase XerD
MNTKKTSPGFPTLLQEFFAQRLIAQRNASARTVAAYRDCFRLLLQYVQQRWHRQPTAVRLDDLGAPVILGFLTYLEKDRGNCIRTRNARLAAIRAFFHYAAVGCPESLPTIQQVLAIPVKRFNRPCLGFLSKPEMDAILEAPDLSTWSGQRDRVMWATFYNTGARVSEIIAIRVTDVCLDRSRGLLLHGKGRKDRHMPLWKSTASQLRQWLRHLGNDPQGPLFPNALGRPLTRSGVEHRLRIAVQRASARCPSLRGRRISPHILRHTTAMHLLQSGVNLPVIALWLGHESPATTHAYFEADAGLKEQALKTLQEPPGRRLPFRPGDKLLQFLESL